MNTTFKVIISILVCLGIGFLGAFATQASVGDWYLTIEKPSFNPPNWIFGPVWTTLYIMMGIAVGWVWSTEHVQKKTALAWFGVQLFFNLLWSFAFFYFESPASALVVILLLLVSIVICMLKFKTVLPKAMYLLIPYLAWVSFASLLNFEIWRLN